MRLGNGVHGLGQVGCSTAAVCFIVGLGMAQNTVNSLGLPEQPATTRSSVAAATPTKTNQESSLRSMAATGNEKELAALLDAGVDINAADDNGCTPLHWACIKGQLGSLKVLLSRGTRTDLLDKNQHSALDWAMELGHTSLVEEFLEQGRDIDTKDRFDRTLLIRASELGLSDLVAKLLAKGANTQAIDNKGDTALHKAAWLPEANAATALLKAGADVNAANNKGFTPLHNAVICGQKNNVEVLLTAGADVSAKTGVGVSALHVAVQKVDVPLTTMLLNKGAPVNVSAVSGDTPLYLAIRDGDKELVKLLMNHGAVPFAEDSRSWPRMLEALNTCPTEISDLLVTNNYRELAQRKDSVGLLQAALRAGNAHMAEMLISEGTSIDINDPDGNNALHFAARLGSASLCKLILAKGADITTFNVNDETPLTCAIYSNNKDTVQLLLDHKAELFTGNIWSWLHTLDALINVSPEVAVVLPNWSVADLIKKKDENEFGWTVLHAAVKQGKPEIVEFLLSNAADPNTADIAGMSPLHWAMSQRCDTRIPKLLIEAGADVSIKNIDGLTPLNMAWNSGFDLKSLCAEFVKDGDDSVQSGDMVEARITYGRALRLDLGPSLRSIAAQSLVLTFADDDKDIHASCIKWMDGKGYSGYAADRVSLAVAEYYLSRNNTDDAVKSLAATAQKNTPLGFGARIVRSICLTVKADRDGATQELQAIAGDPASGNVGFMASYFLKYGLDPVLERPDLLAALDELIKHKDFVAWKEQMEGAGNN